MLIKRLREDKKKWFNYPVHKNMIRYRDDIDIQIWYRYLECTKMVKKIFHASPNLKTAGIAILTGGLSEQRKLLEAVINIPQREKGQHTKNT